MSETYAQKLADAERERSVRVIYISSYIPRPCGIATFTKDLTTSINVLNPTCLAEIVAVNPTGIHYEYPWEVKFRFDQEDFSTYNKAADYINQSSADIVCLEHEYGLFGGESGEVIVEFLKKIKKPIVSTFHTVLPHPDDKKKHILQGIAKYSEAVIVMINAASDRLISEYGIGAEKIVVIPHGVPDVTFLSKPENKGKLRLKNRTVLSTFGLINKGKGIEYAIQALPAIVKDVPDVMYLVLGETHPVVRRVEGEKYRRELQNLVRELGMEKYVKFINRYLDLEEVITYLQATDIYITPYLNPDQITSGTLAYAVGAGLPCISTPYKYAEEVLDGERGMLVPYRDPESIAKNVVKLSSSPKVKARIQKKAYEYGRQMTWDNVALKHLDLFTHIIEKQQTSNI